MRTRLLFLVVAAALPANAALAEGLDELPYTGVRASYVTADIDDFEEDAAGVGLGVSFDVGQGVFVQAGYATAKTRDFDILGFRGSIEVSELGLGLGYHHALGPKVDLVPLISVVRAETEVHGDFAALVEGDDDTGWSAGLGVRALVTPSVELSGGLSYVDIYDDGSTSFSVEAFFHPASWLGVGAGYDVADDATTLSFTGRIVF
jgi:opacity protein-like surface antigen